MPEESVAANRELWTRNNARYTNARARQAWLDDEITWGVWHCPESRVNVLPTQLAGLDVVELGCGTAYVSAWLARREGASWSVATQGARPERLLPEPG
jgi:hypothetical protein